MSHDIYTTSNGKDSMAFTGKTPWHGLGQMLTKGASIDEWINESNMGFKFEKKPLNYWNNEGELIEIKDQFVIVRNDTNAQMSIVSNRYQIVQPEQAIEFFRDFAQAGDMTLETAGSIQDGKKFWALAKIKDNNSLNISESDKIEPYVLLASSCDKSMSTIAKLTSIRVVCNNTLSLAVNGSTSNCFKVSHSSKFDPDNIKSKMGLVNGELEKHGKIFKKLSNIKITEKQAVKFFLEVLKTKKEKQEGTIDLDVLSSKKRSIEKIMNSYDTAPGSEKTMWGAVNAVTHSVDYNPSAQSNDTRLNSAWFATGEAMKNEAYQLAQDNSLLDSIIDNTSNSGNVGISNLLDMIDL